MREFNLCSLKLQMSIFRVTKWEKNNLYSFFNATKTRSSFLRYQGNIIYSFSLYKKLATKILLQPHRKQVCRISFRFILFFLSFVLQKLRSFFLSIVDNIFNENPALISFIDPQIVVSFNHFFFCFEVNESPNPINFQDYGLSLQNSSKKISIFLLFDKKTLILFFQILFL